jgi:tetrapyrrole methylase family protein/MazG family protein
MKTKKLNELEAIIEKLRSDEGCPWDQELTFESLSELTLEETYELIDAVSKNENENIIDELSDILTHIMFYAHIANSKKLFTFEEIIENAKQKLISRHPHVFDKKNFGSLKTSDEVKKNWNNLKIIKNNTKKKTFLDNFNFNSPASIFLSRFVKKLIGMNIISDEHNITKEELKKNPSKELFKIFYTLIQNDIDPEIILRKEIINIKEKIEIKEKIKKLKFEEFEKEEIKQILFDN